MRMRTFSIIIVVLSLFNCGSDDESGYQEPYNPNDDDGPVAVDPLTDDEIMDLTQQETFKYFWNFAESSSGAARERYHPNDPGDSQNVVTTGGSGFGLMAILVGIERGYVSSSEGFERLNQILDFFEGADRFHGAWPHWINGSNGNVIPFSPEDNGGDLVETAFLVQGLLTVAEYFNGESDKEKQLVAKINKLWEEVEWDWYTKNGEDVLYWHWSPEYTWEMNFPVGGYNECLIMYVLAAASPTHSISKSVYEKGWAREGKIVSKDSMYNLPLVLDYFEHDDAAVGPLFWAHYSYLGLNPKGLSDQYADYWLSLIHI